MALLDRIADELKLDRDFIRNTSINSRKHYKKYLIPKKKKGEYRRIYHPSPDLKTLQYWMINNIFNKLPISTLATAYKIGCSIKKNAIMHSKSKHLLHLDIKDFFETIKGKHIENLIMKNEEVLKEYSLSSEDISFINSVCLYDGHLTIGSVSAPSISNCVMYEFDKEISSVISKSQMVYSRYADDMIFSSNSYIDDEIIITIKKLLLKNGFTLNQSKTRFMSPKGRRSVTGLIVDRGKVYIGLKRKREIKSMLYKKLKYDIGDGRRILGHLYFLKDIEPQYFNKLILKYSYFGNVVELLQASTKKAEEEMILSREQAASTNEE